MTTLGYEYFSLSASGEKATELWDALAEGGFLRADIRRRTTAEEWG